MTQCNTLNVKLSTSQLNKLKSGTKNYTEVTLNLPSNMIGGSNGETSFPSKSLLTEALDNNTLANLKLSKTQLSKMVHLGGFLGRHLGSKITKTWFVFDKKYL